MENPFENLPEMPASFLGKLDLLRENLEVFQKTLIDTLADPDLEAQGSQEFHILKAMLPDLQVAVPSALEAFKAAHDQHLAVAKEGLEFANQFPEKLKALEEKAAEDLAPFAIENFTPKPEQKIPNFLDLLDIKSNLSDSQALLGHGKANVSKAQSPPRTSGNIWESWNPPEPGSQKAAEDDKDLPEYVFQLETLRQLGLEPEPENQSVRGGNIWENWS
jgi:hypothetical protein